MSVLNGRELCEGEPPLKLPLPIEAKNIPKVDAVLYTHADFDHFRQLTAQVLSDRFLCRFIAPGPVVQQLKALGVGEARIKYVHDGDVLQVGKATIIITPALHDWQEQNPWQLGNCCGYLIKTLDGKIWHPGDTRTALSTPKLRSKRAAGTESRNTFRSTANKEFNLFRSTKLAPPAQCSKTVRFRMKS
jgi:L-ascorbate metabolism protein UlaG (beta-lactamase superfamily)